MKLFTNSNDENTSLGLLERSAYGCGNMANGLVFAAINAFLVFYYTNAIGLSAATIGTIMLVSRLFDGVTDLVMGQIVDRSHTRFGKTRGWVLYMCLPYALSAILVFSVPLSWAPVYQYIYVFISYNLCNSFLFTALSVPYSTLGSMLTRDPLEHGWIGIFGMLFAMFASLLVNATAMKFVGQFGGDAHAWTITIAIYAVIGIVLHLICFFGTHERTGSSGGSASDGIPFKTGVKALLQNKYWLLCVCVITLIWISSGTSSSAFVYYTDSVLGNTDYYAQLSSVYTITMVVALFVSAIFIKKLGKVNTFRLGVSIMLSGIVVNMLAPLNITALMISRALNGIGSGLGSACLGGLSLDTIDYGEWKTGIRVASLNCAAMSFAQKVGTGLASGVLGIILSLGGYDKNPVSASAITAVKVCNIYLPLVICILIILLLIPYHLDKEFPTILKDLAARKNQLGNANQTGAENE